MESVPWISLLLAFLLVYAPKAVTLVGQVRSGKPYDNHHPRDRVGELTGTAKRAYAAHLNGIEGFAPFAAALLACEIRHVDPLRVAVLSAAFVACRCLYIVCYVTDRATARSSVWAVGMLCTVALFVSAITG